MNTNGKKVMMGLAVLLPVMAANAAQSLPTNDFFNDGQTWHLQRVTGEGDEVTIDNLVVTVDGDDYVEATMDYNGHLYPTDAFCKRLVVTENDEVTRTYYAFQQEGQILVKSEKKNEFVPLLDFACKSVNSLKIGSIEYDVVSADYIHPGDLLRKRVSCSENGQEVSYVFGLGAQEWSLTSDYWPADGTYRLVSMTTAEGLELTPEVMTMAKAECDNEYWSSGKRWDYLTYYPEDWGLENRHSYYMVAGSVTLDEKEGNMDCSALYQTGPEWELPTTAINPTPVVSINGQVYEYDKVSQRFLLGMDFNIQQGEEAVKGMDVSEVKEINTLRVGARDFKRIVFDGAETDSEWSYWVEGIGANGRNTLYNYPLPPDGSKVRLEACYDDNGCIFTYADFKAPSGVNLNITEAVEQKDTRTYDLHGRQISNPLPGSIIIREGKKSIVR